MGRLKVMLIPANFHWAEGQLAKFISATCKNTQFIYFGIHNIRENYAEFQDLLSMVDVVHWLIPPQNIDITRQMVADFKNGASYANVISIHHIEPHKETDLIQKAKQANLIHVESSEWKKKVELLCQDTPAHLAQLGVLEKMLYLPKRKLDRKRFRFGTFGNLDNNPRKAPEVLIGACKLLKEKGCDFEIILQGRSNLNLMTALSKNGITCVNLGYKHSHEAFKVYDEIDAYLCTSRIEGGPLPVIEAMANGVPIVSTRVGIAKDALAYGGGVLCNIDDVNGVVEGMERLISDKAFYQECSLRAKSIIATHFSSNLQQDYEQMYRRALELSGNSPKADLLGSLWNVKVQKHNRIELAYDDIRERSQLFYKGGGVFFKIIKEMIAGNLSKKWLIKYLKINLRQSLMGQILFGRLN